MSAELRVRVRRIVVRKPSGPQDHVHGDAGLKTLLPEGKALQLIQPVSFGCAIDDRVLQQSTASTRDFDCGLDGSAATEVL